MIGRVLPKFERVSFLLDHGADIAVSLGLDKRFEDCHLNRPKHCPDCPP